MPGVTNYFPLGYAYNDRAAPAAPRRATVAQFAQFAQFTQFRDSSLTSSPSFQFSVSSFQFPVWRVGFASHNKKIDPLLGQVKQRARESRAAESRAALLFAH